MRIPSPFNSTIFLAIAVALCGYSTLIAQRPLEEALPDDTIFILKISNFAQVLEDMEENPVLAIWNEEDVQEFFEPLVGQLEKAFVSSNLKEELGLEDDQIKELFPGQMVFAMTDLDMSKLDNDDYSGGFIGLVEYDGDFEIIDKLIHHSLEKPDLPAEVKTTVVEQEYLSAKLWMLEEEDEEVEEESDADLEDLEKEQEVWAVYDNILLVSTSLHRVKETISLLEEDSRANSIVSNAAYSRMIDDSEEAELLIYLDLQNFFTLLKADVLNKAQPAQPNFLAITPESVWQALAPEAMEGIYVTVDTNGREPVIYSGFLFSERRGISSLLAYAEGEVSRPDYISREAMSAKVTLFSLSEFWRNLEGMIAGISPFWYQYYETFLDQVKTQAGIDLKTSFFNNIDDEIVSFSELGQQKAPNMSLGLEDADTVIVLSLKDHQGFEMALETLKPMLAGFSLAFEEREYLGTTIFSFKSNSVQDGQTAAGQSFSYALTNRFLLLGLHSVSLLEATLARLEEPTDSLWDDEDLEEALDDLPPGATELNYQDFGAFLNTLFVTLARAQERVSKEDSDYFEFCLPDKLPGKLDFPYFLVAKSYLEENGLFTKALVRKRSE